MAIGGGGGGGAIRAGQAFVELLGKDSGLARSLDQALARVKAFGQQVALVGAGVAAGGAAILAPITGLFAAAVERGATLDSLARQLGTTVEEVSALGYAFEAAGIKQTEFLDVVKTLDQKLSQAADGKDEAAEAFRRLGLSVKDVIGLSPAQRLEAVGKALGQVAMSADRTEFAMKLLGGQGGKALRIFEQGPGKLRDLMGRASEVGAVMDGDTAAAATRVSAAFTEMWAAAKYALLSIGEALLPQAGAIEEFTRTVAQVAGGIRQWVQENQHLILGAVTLGAALVAGGTALAVLGLGLSTAATAASGLAAGLVLVKGAVLALASPAGILAAGLAAIAAQSYLILTRTEAGQALVSYLTGQLAPAWGTVATAATDAWRGIGLAMRRGDLAAAGEIAMAGLNVAVAQGWLSVKKLWVDSVRYLSDEWSTATFGMRLVFTEITDSIQETFTRMIAWLLDGASGLARTLGKGDLASGLDDYAREVRRGADLDARRADRRRKEITDELLADVGKRADDAADALAGPRLALEEARKRLAELVTAEDGKAGLKAATSQLPAVQAQVAQTLARSVRGGFQAPNFAALLGAGDSVAQRQLRAQEVGNQKLDEIKAELKKRPPLFG